jgi:hypothetical protein
LYVKQSKFSTNYAKLRRRRMKKKHIRDTPVIKVAEGYDLEEVMDTDDTGYDNGEPVLIQEVEVEYE